jgi:hypothetical protein
MCAPPPEEVRLVPAQDERRERIDAPGPNEGVRQLPLARLLRQPVTPGREPLEQEHARCADGEQQDGDREPLADPGAERRRARGRDPGGRLHRLAQRKPEGVRLIRGHPVEPERDAAVRDDPSRREDRTKRDPRVRFRVAGRVEVVAPRE